MIKIIFCLPGKSFSHNFIKSWTNLVACLPGFKVDFSLNGAVSSNVYMARTLCLIEDESLTSHQKPFDGLYEYDYIMWIDSDSIFEPKQFKSLLDRMEKSLQIDILSGIYLQDQGQEYTTVVSLNTDSIKKQGRPKFLTPHDIAGKKGLIKVAYTGMGFMLVRYGVFERLSYPWFLPVIMKDGQHIAGFASEDASFCFRAKELGFDIWIDPKVVVGHEKLAFVRRPNDD